MNANQITTIEGVIATVVVLLLLKRVIDFLSARREAKLQTYGQQPIGKPITSPFDWILPANPAYACLEEQIVFEVARALLKLGWIFLKWTLIVYVVAYVGAAALLILIQVL